MAVTRIHVRVDGREAIFAGGLREIAVGDGPGCLVRVDGPGVGERHAILLLTDDGWTVEPFASELRLYCDGEPVWKLAVDRPLRLRLGDADDGPLVEVAPADEDAIGLATSGGADLVDAPRTHASARRDTATPTPTRAGPGEGGRFHIPAGTLRVGRDPTSDIVVPDVLVSRHHAEIRRTDAGIEVVDLGSHNGTFVNGHRVERAPLAERDVVLVGRHSFGRAGDHLEEQVDTGEVAYAAAGVTVRLRDGTVLVDRVSFSLESRSLLAVIGPSGSGKTTLVRALTGVGMADEGDVRYDDQSLYAAYDALRRRIGYVPQDEIVHTELPVRRTLEYAAALRFPADVDERERHARVDQVLAELDLGDRADVRVSALSGGQRTRVGVALELLTQPSLLFLDEPTSGLDPHSERSLMELFRRLADGGRTVVVVTHSPQSLRLCDRVLVLAPGGGVAYFGLPQLLGAYFGAEGIADVFAELSRRDAGDWAERFRGHAYHQQFVERPDVAGERHAARAESAGTPRRTRGWGRQFLTLTRRYAAVLAADRRNLALLVAQAPLLGLLMLVALPADELAATPPGELRLISRAALVLFVIVVGVTWLGMSNAVREIAKELPVFRRERDAGVATTAYVASKAVVLGTLTAVQAGVLVALATARQGGPTDAVVLGWPLGELIVLAALTGLAAMGLGLLVSALARTADRAGTILPIVLVVELVLALGGVFPQIGEQPVIEQLGYAASTRWGFAGSAATADLDELQSVTGVLTRAPSVDLDDPDPLFDAFARGARGDALWDHEASAWLTDAGALLAITLLALAAAVVALRRDGASQRAG